jgi:hypothetical protein
MSEYYTLRRVELKNKGGASFIPRVMLQPMTKLTLLGMVDPKRLGAHGPDSAIWYEVLVESGRSKDKTGYLGTEDFDTPVGLANLQHRSPDLSGTVYGLIRVERNDNGAMVQSWPWDARCTQCNGLSVTHALFSIEDTLQAAQLILDELNNGVRKDSRGQSAFKDAKREFMIGCLMVRSGNTIYASHSGQKEDAAFAQVCRKLGLVYSPPVPKNTTLLVRNGGEVQLSAVNDFDYQCAAPRVVQYALKCGDIPDALTEIYGGGAQMGKVVPSCRRCQQTLPYMLCPK